MSNKNSANKVKSAVKDPNEIGKEALEEYFRIETKTCEEKTKDEPTNEEKTEEGKKEQLFVIPTIPGTEDVDALPYYHGLVPREDIKELLTDHGTYLIRTTELKVGEARTYCLSINWDGEVRHFPLKPMPEIGGQFTLGGKNFPTILELLKHYIITGEKFSPREIRLVRAIERQSWELLHAHVRLSTKLGNGAFGEVYSGKLESSKRKWINVAIKVMKCGGVNKEQIENTMAEARCLRHLQHPNIVRCHGVAADIEPIFIIMELVKGGSLDKYLQVYADKIELGERILMLRDISSAIGYLHDENVLHCDIASRNCLHGEGITKVSDFGMSRKADNGAIAQNERMPVRWMAPDAFDTHSFSKKTDVWALGVLFWEIFANAAEPYTGWTGQQVREQVTYHKFHMSMPEGTPDELNELVGRMFAFEPENRATMKVVLKDVEKPLIFETKKKRKCNISVESAEIDAPETKDSAKKNKKKSSNKKEKTVDKTMDVTVEEKAKGKVQKEEKVTAK